MTERHTGVVNKGRKLYSRCSFNKIVRRATLNKNKDKSNNTYKKRSNNTE